MRSFPVPDPGTPDLHRDLRSPARFLLWTGWRQRWSIANGVLWGVVWMSAQAVSPFVVGRGIDAVRRSSSSALLGWTGVLLGLGAVTAVAGLLRHRAAVANFLYAVWRTRQLLLRHQAGLGGSLSQRVDLGEAAGVVTVDADNIGSVFDISARGSGALVSFVVVAVVLLTASVPLGLLVLIGVPVLVLGLGPLLRPLHARQETQRELLSEASTLAADTVAGLRVLRGIGGEAEVSARYRAASTRVRDAGISLARLEATLDAMQVLLPGVLVVVVTVVGARLAVEGSITPGTLLTFYGSAAFLVLPLRTATEFLDAVTRGLVAARHVVDLLRLEPVRTHGTNPEPSGHPELVLGTLTVRPGRFTALVSPDPAASTAFAEQLVGLRDGTATWGGTPLTSLPEEVLRRRLLLQDQAPWLFRGRLRDDLDPGGARSELDLLAALEVASAVDVLDALPGGLDAELAERGRELSGGQRQRLALARSLLTPAEVLVLDEPTASVDAHTEARIARSLAGLGRTVVVLTSSPLVLEAAHAVVLLDAGRVVAEGLHRQLLARADYRDVVARDEVLT